jgi:hypothetical protein
MTEEQEQYLTLTHKIARAVDKIVYEEAGWDRKHGILLHVFPMPQGISCWFSRLDENMTAVTTTTRE